MLKGVFFVLFFLIVVCLHTDSHAQRALPASNQQITLSFSPIVKQVSPAVVNVYAKRKIVQRSLSPFANDPFFRRFFGDVPFGGQQRERLSSSLGSGVIVSKAGLIVTNNHVIQNATEIKVALNDGREFECEILIKDERTDLAVLKILEDNTNLPSVSFGDSDNLEVGDLVLAIGNPFGVGQTVTQGIVSALARTRVGVSDFQFFIQTDAAINPGNSGGALIDMNGNLVGINTAIFSRSGGSNGIGFAIPSSMVELVVNQALQGETVVRRPYLGASLQDITPDIAESLGLDKPRGAIVASVVKGGPAEKAGIQRSDVILAVDGIAISDPNAFGYRFTSKGIGGEISLTISRGNDIFDIMMPLVPAPETTPRDVRILPEGSPFAGAKVANLSPALAEEIGIKQQSGVVILEMDPTMAAARAGFQPGDIIVSVNGTVVTLTETFETLAQQPSRFWRIVFERGGRRSTLVFRG
jgi:Do/DeqQ family serine protease